MNVLVTGSSKGLGLALCKSLLAGGHSVIGISRGANANEDLKKVGPRKMIYDRDFVGFKHFQGDMQNESLSEEVLAFLLEGKIKIDAFVNNAATAYDDLITNVDFKKLESMFKTNILTPIMLTETVLKNFLLHGTKGSIIHLSSISVHTGYKGLSMYAATKGALEAFSKNTAREWGSFGIRSNCVVAGFMNTDMSASLSEDQKNRIYNRTSLKEETSIDSVVETIEFLISKKSKSITGQNIFVDSGTI